MIENKVLEKLNKSREALDELYEQSISGKTNFNYEYIYFLGREIDFQFRSGLLRGIIIGRGYAEQMDAITYDINKAVQRIIPDRKPVYRRGPYTYIDTTYARTINDSMLQFGAEYIDRWIMYYELFGGRAKQHEKATRKK